MPIDRFIIPTVLWEVAPAPSSFPTSSTSSAALFCQTATPTPKATMPRTARATRISFFASSSIGLEQGSDSSWSNASYQVVASDVLDSCHDCTSVQGSGNWHCRWMDWMEIASQIKIKTEQLMFKQLSKIAQLNYPHFYFLPRIVVPLSHCPTVPLYPSCPQTFSWRYLPCNNFALLPFSFNHLIFIVAFSSCWMKMFSLFFFSK